ncbi:MAG: MlaD family protein [Candidatus Acidiferrales bacterium]
MDSKKEQAMVGLFVLVAAGLLIGTVFALSGVMGKDSNTYRASFKFAGGLEPGAVVRYVGGPKVGRVEQLRIDEEDPSKIEITFSIDKDVPVKTDSKAKIFFLGALAENYLEIAAGAPEAKLAPSGSELPTEEFTSLADIATKINALGPEAERLLMNLNSRVEELQQTVARVNDLINATNRANIAASLASTRGMLEENRPIVKRTLSNVEEVSAKAKPLIDDLRATITEAQKAIKNADALIAENRPDIEAAIGDLRKALNSASSALDQVDRTMNYNAENIDEMLENVRHTTENLKQFTDIIKTRPSSLIRSSGPPERKPGGPTKN